MNDTAPLYEITLDAMAPEELPLDENAKTRDPATKRTIRRKTYVVRRDDGTYGYFHPDQIEEV